LSVTEVNAEVATRRNGTRRGQCAHTMY
jgi:hypothetical protein